MDKLWIGIVALAAAGGCATERDSATVSDIERAAALELVGQITALHRLSLEPTATDQLIAAVRFDPAARLIATNRAPLEWRVPEVLASTTSCITTTATTATFAGCQVEGHWVDGTISRAGPNTHAELIDVFILDAGSQGATSIDGALALTGDTIDGAVSLDANWSQDQRDIILHAAVAFDGVVLDAHDCPVAGSLTIDGSLSAPPRVAELTIQLGPACGDMQIVR